MVSKICGKLQETLSTGLNEYLGPHSSLLMLQGSDPLLKLLFPYLGVILSMIEDFFFLFFFSYVLITSFSPSRLLDA